MPVSTAKKKPVLKAVPAPAPDHRVKDLALAEWGRKEIELAEKEMPGLMAIRREYASASPARCT